MNQELYGPPTHSTWWGLIIDPENRIAPYRDLTLYPPDTLFHPTFLYESLWCLLVFCALVFVKLRWKKRLLEGDVLLGYIMAYPLGRFFIEYLRPDAWVLGSLAAAQWFAIVCVAGGAVALVLRHVFAKGRASSSMAGSYVDVGGDGDALPAGSGQPGEGTGVTQAEAEPAGDLGA